MLRPESTLNERYRLDERIATGGMGSVWRGTDLVLGRQVAVKVLLPGLLADPSFIARFRSEARMMAALRHPGIAAVFDSGEDTAEDGTRTDYLVMEYVDGATLSSRIDERGQLSVAETLSIVEQAARALHAAHGNGIVHRDVKPSNLLVKPDGSVVLVDFGVARSTSVTSVTSTNAIPGTALYMAPEQAAGKPVSAATDVYALGAVAYCCLTGEPPFTGDNPLEVAIKHLHDEPAPLPAELPDAVRLLVERALAKDPAARFPDAAAMANAARAAARNEPTALAAPLAGAPLAGGALAGGAATGAPAAATQVVRSDGPTAADAAGPDRRRRRAAVSVAGAVLLGLAGLTAVFAFQPNDSPEGGKGGGAPQTTVTTGPTDKPTPDTTEDRSPSRQLPVGTATSVRPTPSANASSAPTTAAPPTSTSPDPATQSPIEPTDDPAPPSTPPASEGGGSPAPDTSVTPGGGAAS